MMLKLIVIINFKYSGAIVIHDYSCIVYNFSTGTSWSKNINCNSCSPAYSKKGQLSQLFKNKRRKLEPKTQSLSKLLSIPSARLSKVSTREKASATDNCTVVPGGLLKEPC